MRLKATTIQTTRLTPYELMTRRAMQLPESIITGGTDVCPLKDNQEIKDAERELEMLPDVPTAGRRVLVKTLPDKPGFAPKWNGPYEIIISGDTCACIDIRGKGVWKHWTQLKLYKGISN